MAQLELYIKPYEIRQAIAKNSGQTDLDTLQTAIAADVASELPFVCPKCQWVNPDTNTIEGKGLIPTNNPNNPNEERECDVCFGWGATETAVTTTQIFGIAPQPSVEQP